MGLPGLASGGNADTNPTRRVGELVQGACWNYLYLSQQFAAIDDPAKREEFVQALRHGSPASWRHVNLLGEYDFSDARLKDSVGIKPPKLID